MNRSDPHGSGLRRAEGLLPPLPGLELELDSSSSPSRLERGPPHSDRAGTVSARFALQSADPLLKSEWVCGGDVDRDIALEQEPERLQDAAGQICMVDLSLFPEVRQVHLHDDHRLPGVVRQDRAELVAGVLQHVQNRTSVSALLRNELKRLVRENEAYGVARRAVPARLAKGSHLGGDRLPTREELYDRGPLR